MSIVAATRDAARGLALECTLLLGTRTTMEADMYPRALDEAGVRIVVPGEDDRKFIDHSIYNELALGQVNPKTQQRYLDICGRHIDDDGVDSVILGCTELPLVISSDDFSIEVLDTTRIHVAAILAAAA